ncbi:MAG: ABC transporter ATP-binding protein/permease, partial [Actinobacteria bacterium]|nr:ABC transporter ATP-binding protein/permease [Actinomycetota bacterium]
MASTVVVSVADLARPFPLKLVIDRVFASGRVPPFHITGGDVRLIAFVGVLVLVIALADAVASYQMDVRLQRAGEDIMHDLRVALYAHLQRLSLVFHERRHPGDLVTRLTGDVSAVGSLFSDSLGTLVSSALLLVGMVVVAILIDPVLAAVSFAVTPVLAYVAFSFRSRIKAIAKRERAKDGEIASLTTETLSAMRVVKALGSERFEHRRLHEKSEERREAGVEAAQVEGKFGGLIDVLGAVGSATVLVLGVFRVAAGVLSPGDLVVMFSYVKKIYRPLRDIARQANKVSQATVRADRVAEILSADDILNDKPDGYSGPRSAGHLTLHDVAFAYDPARPVLAGFSLDIPAGQKVALVGRSGAGKSTLAALIARFYDPTEGRVEVDGRDARDCSVKWLRDQMGIVLQDTVLFTGTVAENISYGVDADEEDIVAAARAADADDFIRALPDGYATELGPRAVGLSGGQRQRIAIARTLLRDPPILLLDEPTTGLDAASEAEVLGGLDVLMKDRTTIIITHSLALAQTADRILVMQNGKLIQEGTPSDLLAVEGPFRKLAQDQGLIAAGRRTELRDPRMPHVDRLLDASAVEPALARCLNGSSITAIEIRRLRYWPGERMIVHFGVEVDGIWTDATATTATSVDLARRATKPRSVEIAAAALGRTPATEPLRYDEDLEALIQWLPVDLSMPPLAIAPDVLSEHLDAAGVPRPAGTPGLIRYKPRKRATFRWDGTVLKFYKSVVAFERGWQGLNETLEIPGMRTAKPLAMIPDLQLTVQTFLDG